MRSTRARPDALSFFLLYRDPMTDSERLARVRKNLWRIAWSEDEEDARALLRLLDTTRSERDAALREVEALKHDIESALDGLSKEAADRDAALARVGILEEALKVRAWTEEERDGMARAYASAEAKHGFYETIFAVGAWLLRHRAEEAALTPPAYPPEQPL